MIITPVCSWESHTLCTWTAGSTFRLSYAMPVNLGPSYGNPLNHEMVRIIACTKVQRNLRKLREIGPSLRKFDSWSLFDPQISPTFLGQGRPPQVLVKFFYIEVPWLVHSAMGPLFAAGKTWGSYGVQQASLIHHYPVYWTYHYYCVRLSVSPPSKSWACGPCRTSRFEIYNHHLGIKLISPSRYRIAVQDISQTRLNPRPWFHAKR